MTSTGWNLKPVAFNTHSETEKHEQVLFLHPLALYTGISLHITEANEPCQYFASEKSTASGSANGHYPLLNESLETLAQGSHTS